MTINKILRIVLIVSCIATGLSKLPPKHGFIDKEFNAYLKQWVKDAKIYKGENYSLPTITIIFGKVDIFRTSFDGSPIGVCVPIPFAPFIMIDKDYWKWHSEGEREQLLFH